jgi:predicted enzyme related to lactoylglutathione lyase
MTASVTHFEILAQNLGSLADFYRQLFGWQIDKATGVDYFHIQTGPAGGNSLRGGLTYRALPQPRSWVHYVSVKSLDDAIERLLTLGGKIVREKTAVPKTAWYAIVEDPQGNIFGMWEADPKAFPPLEPEV